jgi:hypothetical protein
MPISFWVGWGIVMIGGIGLGVRGPVCSRTGAGIILAAGLLFILMAVGLALSTEYSISGLLTLYLGVREDPLYLSKAVLFGYTLVVYGMTLFGRGIFRRTGQ